MKFGNGNLIVLQTHLHRIPTWARWASSAPSDGHSRLCGWPNRCSPAPSVPWPSRCHVWNVGRHNLYKPPKRKTNMRIEVRNMVILWLISILVVCWCPKKNVGLMKGGYIESTYGSIPMKYHHYFTIASTCLPLYFGLSWLIYTYIYT